MFKEKLKQVQEYESKAAISIEKANEDCAKIISEARKTAVEAGSRAKVEAADKAGAVSEAIDAEIAGEIAAIDKTYQQMIDDLKATSTKRIEPAAAEIARRVIGEAGK